MLIVPETVPVWTVMGKSIAVLPVGILKSADVPPDEN